MEVCNWQILPNLLTLWTYFVFEPTCAYCTVGSYASLSVCPSVTGFSKSIIAMNRPLPGFQFVSPWAEISPWEINFDHFWDQCKSLEKTFCIWGVVGVKRLEISCKRIFWVFLQEVFLMRKSKRFLKFSLLLRSIKGWGFTPWSLKWLTPYPRPFWRPLPQPRFSAPEAFARLEPCLLVIKGTGMVNTEAGGLCYDRLGSLPTSSCIFVPRLTKWGRGTIEFASVCPSVRSLCQQGEFIDPLWECKMLYLSSPSQLLLTLIRFCGVRADPGQIKTVGISQQDMMILCYNLKWRFL